MLHIDDRNLHSKRELNVFLQGQLSALDSLRSNAAKRLRWPFREFTDELLGGTRDQVHIIYKEHFPESDLK